MIFWFILAGIQSWNFLVCYWAKMIEWPFSSGWDMIVNCHHWFAEEKCEFISLGCYCAPSYAMQLLNLRKPLDRHCPVFCGLEFTFFIPCRWWHVTCGDHFEYVWISDMSPHVTKFEYVSSMFNTLVDFIPFHSNLQELISIRLDTKFARGHFTLHGEQVRGRRWCVKPWLLPAPCHDVMFNFCRIPAKPDLTLTFDQSVKYFLMQTQCWNLRKCIG